MFGVGSLVLLLLTTAAAQRPDFSGEWALDWQASGLRVPDPRISLSIKQSGDDLIVGRNNRGMSGVGTWKLDGTATTGKSSQGDVRSTATWEGNKLIMTSTVVTATQTQVATETFLLEAGKLVTESTFMGSTTRLVFTKVAGVTTSLGSPRPATPPANPRARWNEEFEIGAPELRSLSPSELLTEVVKGRTPGAALDLGVGEGRNALYLAEKGWDVTGVDISDAAVAQARKNATDRRLKINAVVADLDAYDFGEARWDLVTSFYMHSWHRSSKTDVPARILRSLKPGGLLVMEAFRRPPNTNGFVVAELAAMFKGFRIIKNEEGLLAPDWGLAAKTHMVRFVAEKPRN